MLDGGYQQRCIGASFVDGDVGDDPTLRLLHFNARPELRRLVQLSLPNDLSPRLEKADDLAWSARLTAKHAASSLTDHLTHPWEHGLDVRDETVDPSARSASHPLALLARRLGGAMSLPGQASRDPQEPPIRLLDRAPRTLASSAQTLGNLAYPARDAAMHVAKAKAEIDASPSQSPNRAAQHPHGVFAHAAVGRMVDGRFNHGRIDAQLSALCHACVARHDDQSFEKQLECITVEQLPQSNHSLGVGYLARIDATKPSIDEAAGDLSLELVVAPVHQMLESQSTQHGLRWRPVPSTTPALRPAPTQHLQYAINQSFVFERPIDLPQPGHHELLHLRHHQSEEHHLRDRQLRLSSANHLDLRRYGSSIDHIRDLPSIFFGRRAPNTPIPDAVIGATSGRTATSTLLSAPPCS